MTFLFILFVVVAVVAVVMSFKIMRNQKNKAWAAGDINKKVLDSPFKMNPIIILYWVTPFVMIIGAVLLAYYYNWGLGE